MASVAFCNRYLTTTHGLIKYLSQPLVLKFSSPYTVFKYVRAMSPCYTRSEFTFVTLLQVTFRGATL